MPEQTSVKLGQRVQRAPEGLFASLVKDRRGATAIEYAVIASLLSIAIVAAVNSIGSEVNAMFTDVKGSF